MYLEKVKMCLYDTLKNKDCILNTISLYKALSLGSKEHLKLDTFFTASDKKDQFST